MEAMFTKVEQVPDVTGVVEPLLPRKQDADLQGRHDRVRAGQHRRLRTSTSGAPYPTASRLPRADVNVPGLTVELGGDIFSDGVKPPATEAFGLLAAVFILLIAFGSLLAMGLPIVTALFGIAIGIAVVEPARERDARSRLHDAGRVDDRHRRRHRLRAVHRHPLPRGPARTARARCRGPAVDRHGGPGGRVRRSHRRHLAARHVPHGGAVRARPRRRLQHRGARW